MTCLGRNLTRGASLSVRPELDLAGLVLALMLAWALPGCTVGPDYQRPAAFTGGTAPPPAFAESAPATNVASAATWGPAQPAADRERGAWWRIFNDAELDRVEALAGRDNPGLAAALARVDEARAVVGLAGADRFPHVNLGASYTRQRTSANQPQNGRPAGEAHTFNTFTLPLEAAWEPDLWGRVRRQVEAARARLAASDDDTAAVRLLVEAEVATAYFALRTAEAELELLRRTTETYRQSWTLTRNRRAGGIANDLEVSQAETQLRTAEAQQPALSLEVARWRHALAALCGRPAAGFELAAAGAPLPLPPSPPDVVPSTLLEHRPDVAAAERRMAAANAGMGVARTAFYPRFVVRGLAGFQSIDAASWFDWPSRLWAVGPSLEWPVFQGGRNRAQLAAAEAAYAALVAEYRGTVVRAFQEVEDQLAAHRWLAEQLVAEQAAVAAARRTVEVANNRYHAGLVTYLEVATAQAAELNRERSALQLTGSRLAASVGLIRAIGAGWTPADPASAK